MLMNKKKINVRLKLRQEIFRLIEWIKIYPLRPDHEKLADLKAKKDKALNLIKDKKQKGEEIGLGLKVRLNALQQGINNLESKELDYIQVFNSKYIDKVRIKFNGTGNLRILYLKRLEDIPSLKLQARKMNS